MIYGVGYTEFLPEERRHKITIQKHIPKEEYENHKLMLGEASKLSSMTKVYQLFERNGKEFLEYSSQIKFFLKEKRDREQIYLEANRLLINYLSSLSMFIDYGERYNKKHFGKAKLQEYSSKTHDFYDNHVSYRFMALMRNYALHYGFPLSNITESISGRSGIFASKNNLLNFKAWKHAKADIEKMPDLISLDIHVEISMLFIKHLYESYVYDIAPIVLKGVEYVNNLIKENGGNTPILMTTKDIESFKNGEMSVNIIEPKEYKKVLEIITSHPSIEVKAK